MAKRRDLKAQSAFEYLATYSWALLVASVIAVVFLIFLYIPQNGIPQTCTFNYGITCEGINIGSNAMTTVINLVLINSQNMDIQAPQVSISLNQYGIAMTSCLPANVLSAGVMICTASLPRAVPLDIGISGGIIVKAAACVNGVEPSCQYTSNVVYTGNFTTYTGAYIGTVPANVFLYKSTSSSVVEGTQVLLTASTMIFGKPQRGGSVLFSVTPSTGSVSINSGVSDTSGNVITYFSSTVPGTYTVTATFAGHSSSNTITVIV